jgi:hypothetical protein
MSRAKCVCSAKPPRTGTRSTALKIVASGRPNARAKACSDSCGGSGGFEMIDRVDGVVQGAGREFGPFSECLREAARERPERGQYAMQTLGAPGRMHAADQLDHPVQFVIGRGGEPDQARAVTQRVEQQQ